MARSQSLRVMRNALIATLSTLWLVPSYVGASFLLHFCLPSPPPGAIPKPVPSVEAISQVLLGCSAALLAATWFAWSFFLVNRFLPLGKAGLRQG